MPALKVGFKCPVFGNGPIYLLGRPTLVRETLSHTHQQFASHLTL